MSDTSPEPDNSQIHLRESLSALLDGEANELEMHRVLDHLDDPEFRQMVLSYQRIGAAIRDEQTPFSDIDLSGSIRDAIADEPLPQNDEAGKSTKPEWWSALGRMAVAASVAVATVLGVQFWQLANRGDDSHFGDVAAVSPAEETVPSDYLPSTDMFGVRGLQAGFGSEQGRLTPEQISRARGYVDQVAQVRFRAYMLEHAEQSSAYGGNVIPFVRATSFEMMPR